MFPEIVASNKARILLAIFISTIVTVISFYPTINNGFTNWDDEGNVVKNPFIRNFSLEELTNPKSNLFFANYIPITALTYMVEYRLFKLNPTVYHVTNLLFHLLNTILVFIFIHLLSKSTLIAIMVSLLFGVHPMHVESVAWISERKDVVYSFFYLLSLICYILYCRDTINRKFYFLSLFLYILSILSKPMAFSLPLVLFLLDYTYTRQWGYKLLIEKAPFFIFTIPFFITTLYLQQSALTPHMIIIFPDNILFLCYRLLFYIVKLIFPFGLSSFYPYPEKISDHFPFIFWLYFFIVVVLCFVFFLCYKRVKDNKDKTTILFGILFFFITILPVIQIIPIGRTITSDRYTYVPYIGLFYIVCYFFSKLFGERYTVHKNIKGLAIALSIVAILSFCWLSWHRCLIWKDSITLWSDVIAKYPKVTIAYNNRGLAYMEIGEFKKALDDYKKALDADPNDYTTHTNLCTFFIRNGEYRSAYAYCSNAIKLKSHPFEALNSLGTIFFHLHEYEKAIMYYKMAINIHPNYDQAYYNLCSTYRKKMEYGLAIDACKRAIEIRPDYVEAYDNIGSIFAQINNHQMAIQFYKKALEIDPDYASAHNNLSVIYYYSKLYDLAEIHFRKAVQLGYKVHPDFSEKILNKKDHK